MRASSQLFLNPTVLSGELHGMKKPSAPEGYLAWTHVFLPPQATAQQTGPSKFSTTVLVHSACARSAFYGDWTGKVGFALRISRRRIFGLATTASHSKPSCPRSTEDSPTERGFAVSKYSACSIPVLVYAHLFGSRGCPSLLVCWTEPTEYSRGIGYVGRDAARKAKTNAMGIRVARWRTCPGTREPFNEAGPRTDRELSLLPRAKPLPLVAQLDSTIDQLSVNKATNE